MGKALANRCFLCEGEEKAIGNLLVHCQKARILWGERNRVAFPDVAFSVYRMKMVFLCDLWSWSNMYIYDRVYSLRDFFFLTLLGCK